jgi:CheY-like chemotaxis protein
MLKDRPDVCFIEGALPDIETAEIVAWIRKQPPPLRFIPIIVMSGYTQLRTISAARDSGANLVVRKPVSPQMLFDRLSWVAGTQRPFIETDNFLGPDRRFHDIPPPDGRFKRETDAAMEKQE